MIPVDGAACRTIRSRLVVKYCRFGSRVSMSCSAWWLSWPCSRFSSVRSSTTTTSRPPGVGAVMVIAAHALSPSLRTRRCSLCTRRSVPATTFANPSRSDADSSGRTRSNSASPARSPSAYPRMSASLSLARRKVPSRSVSTIPFAEPASTSSNSASTARSRPSVSFNDLSNAWLMLSCCSNVTIRTCSV